MSEETKEEKKELFKAKTVSLIGKILICLLVLTGFIFYWLGKLPNATPNDIVVCGLVMLGILTGTIDANIIIDKFKK